VKNTPESLPSDLAAAHAMILAERAERVKAEAFAASVQEKAVTAQADAANARAVLSSSEALIAHLMEGHPDRAREVLLP
jgi:transposase